MPAFGFQRGVFDSEIWLRVKCPGAACGLEGHADTVAVSAIGASKPEPFAF